MSDDQFLSLIGPMVLDMLPKDQLWDRLVVIESAPGAGKTTILRLFTPTSLRLLERLGRQEAYRPLYDRLKQLEILTPHGPTVIGVLINCREQYATIQDLPFDSPMQIRWFFGLLDARITLLTLRSILSLQGLSYPDDVVRIEFRPNDRATVPALPITGSQLYEKASEAEKVLTDSLNSLVGARNISAYTLNNLQTPKSFSTSDIYLDAVRLPQRLLFMFDDVHELAHEQRRALRRELEQRDLAVARWIAQRSQAVEPVELLNFAKTEGRDFAYVPIEEWARGARGRGGRFFDLLDEIGNRRAQRAQIGVESFESCLSNLLGASHLFERGKDARDKAKEQALSLASGRQQFSEWVDKETSAAEETLNPFEAALRWRKLAIMIERQARKQQLRLDIPLPSSQLEERETSDIQTAAELFLAKEHRLPFYYGMKRIRQLSSWNIEQFLRVAGDLFEQILVSATLSRSSNSQLTAAQQDTLLRTVSQRRLSALPREVPYGADVQKLVRAIGAFCQEETYRPTAPYAPGVTGVGISTADGDRLREAAESVGDGSLQRLSRAISSAIANNVLEVRPDVNVKGGTWTVFYLNRLYCPVFELPLEYSGFRERITLDDLVAWLTQGFQSQRPARLGL
jgi:hypothetical protein